MGRGAESRGASSAELGEVVTSLRATTFSPRVSDDALGERAEIELADFGAWLLSAENDVLEPAHRCVCHDMGRPLSEYWMNSTHNSCATRSNPAGCSPRRIVRHDVAAGT